MSRDKRHYARGTYLTMWMPFATYVDGAAICADGVWRRLKRIAPTADSYSSIPAAVTVNGKTVSGFVRFATRSSLSTPTDADPAYVVFRATGKNRTQILPAAERRRAWSEQGYTGLMLTMEEALARFDNARYDAAANVIRVYGKELS